MGDDVMIHHAYVIWVPMDRWMPLHSTQMRMPKLHDAHSGSANREDEEVGKKKGEGLVFLLWCLCLAPSRSFFCFFFRSPLFVFFFLLPSPSLSSSLSSFLFDSLSAFSTLARSSVFLLASLSLLLPFAHSSYPLCYTRRSQAFRIG